MVSSTFAHEVRELISRMGSHRGGLIRAIAPARRGQHALVDAGEVSEAEDEPEDQARHEHQKAEHDVEEEHVVVVEAVPAIACK